MNQSTLLGFFKSACLFEASLILLALILGWLVDINPIASLSFSFIPLFYGVIGTIPLMVMFFVMDRIQRNSVTDIRNLLLNTLGPGLRDCHWTDLLILALIAGVSEELLFRGVIQPWMDDLWGATIALIASNVIFGLVHAVTPLYAVLAMVVGVYLSLSVNFGGETNLLIPILIHSLYDFFAFVLLMRNFRSRLIVS